MVQLVQDRRSRQTADEDITPALVVAMVMEMANVVAILICNGNSNGPLVRCKREAMLDLS